MNKTLIVGITIVALMVIGACSNQPRTPVYVQKSIASVDKYIQRLYDIDTSEFEATKVLRAELSYESTKDARDIRDSIEAAEERLKNPEPPQKIPDNRIIDIADSSDHYFLDAYKDLYLKYKKEFGTQEFYSVQVEMEPSGNWTFLVDTTDYSVKYMRTCPDCSYISIRE